LVAVHRLLGEQQQQSGAHVAALGSPAACAVGTPAARSETLWSVKPRGVIGVVASPTVWTAIGKAVAVPM
jgi:hypothetical protein